MADKFMKPNMQLSRRSAIKGAGAGIIAAGTVGLISPASAVTDYERQVLSQVEGVLNGISTAQGRFMQVSAQGQIARGNIYMSRPGKLRFEYDPPSPLMLIADGSWVMQVDKEMEHTAHKRLSNTPLNFLLSPNVSFNNGVDVSNMETVGDSLLITVYQQRTPTDGTLTIIMDKNRMQLQAWQVVDQRGERTTVRLEQMAYGVGIDPNLFVVPQKWRNNG